MIGKDAMKPKSYLKSENNNVIKTFNSEEEMLLRSFWGTFLSNVYLEYMQETKFGRNYIEILRRPNQSLFETVYLIFFCMYIHSDHLRSSDFYCESLNKAITKPITSNLKWREPP